MSLNIPSRSVYNKMLKNYPDVLTVNQLSEALGGVSTKTCYKMLREKKIQSIKIGREYRIAKINVVDFLIGKSKS